MLNSDDEEDKLIDNSLISESKLARRQCHSNIRTPKMDFTWAIRFSKVLTFIFPAWDCCILHNLLLHNIFHSYNRFIHFKLQLQYMKYKKQWTGAQLLGRSSTLSQRTFPLLRQRNEKNIIQTYTHERRKMKRKMYIFPISNCNSKTDSKIHNWRSQALRNLYLSFVV